MPIYEYACPSCGHEFEKIVRYKDPSPPCPECASAEVQKKLSLSAFHLKGGGWYSDAYAGKDNKPGKPDAAAATPASSAPSGDSKATATPAAPAPAAKATPAADSSKPAKSSKAPAKNP